MVLQNPPIIYTHPVDSDVTTLNVSLRVGL